jgi:hypothetical protein
MIVGKSFFGRSNSKNASTRRTRGDHFGMEFCECWRILERVEV